MSENKYKIMPRKACGYNDYVTFCPNCHNYLLVFGGFYKKIKCEKCGNTMRDKIYKESCVAYKIKMDGNYAI